MTGYMAYDREALVAARLAIDRGLTELRSLDLHDPCAHTLSVHLGWLRTALEQVWLPAIERILILDLLTPFARRPPDLGGLGGWDDVTTWAMARQGWSVRHDPTPAPDHPTMTPLVARAFALRLRTEQPLGWSPDDWRHAADAIAAIAADPESSRHFSANLLDWSPLVNALGAARLIGSVPHAILESLARDLVAMRLRTSAGTCLDPYSFVPRSGEILPHASAMFLTHLGLDPAVVGSVAADLVRTTPTTAAFLLESLMSQPLALSAAMAALADDVDLLYRVAPRELVDAALALAVDPDNATPAQAERIVVSAGTRLAATGLHHETVASLVAPWLLAFSPLSSTFSTPPETLARLLATVVSEPRSAHVLASAAEATGFAIDADGAGAALDEAAALVGLVRQLALHTAVADTEHAADLWDTLWAAASIGAALAGFAPGAGVVVAGVSLVVSRWWAPDPTETERHGAMAMDHTLTAMAADAVDEVVGRWRSAGFTIPDPPVIGSEWLDADGSAPSIAYLRALGPWVATLPGGPDGTMSTRVMRVVHALIGPASAAEHLAESL